VVFHVVLCLGFPCQPMYFHIIFARWQMIFDAVVFRMFIVVHVIINPFNIIAVFQVFHAPFFNLVNFQRPNST
jgi:hypothetical protein